MKVPSRRRLVTMAMDVLVVLAVLLTAGMVAAFFGAIGSTEIGGRIADIGAALTVPIGLPEWSTPHGGMFHGDSAITVVLVLGVEWLLSVMRNRRA